MFAPGLATDLAVAAPNAVRAYLLGAVEFDDALALQRRLVYDVRGGDGPALMLCEHPSIVTVGRQGSHAHLHFNSWDLRSLCWRIRWVNRGGGCWLQGPGQIAIHGVFPMKRLGLTIQDCIQRYQRSIIAVLDDFTVHARTRPDSPDVWVHDRPVACVGLAVRDWVTYYGVVLNLNPDLELVRLVRTGRDHAPMTSLERERRGPVRPSLVRQRLLEHLVAQFGFEQPLLFTDHPSLKRKAAVDAFVAAY